MSAVLEELRKTPGYRRAKLGASVAGAVFAVVGLAGLPDEVGAWGRWIGGLDSWVPYALCYATLLLVCIVLLVTDVWAMRNPEPTSTLAVLPVKDSPFSEPAPSQEPPGVRAAGHEPRERPPAAIDDLGTTWEAVDEGPNGYFTASGNRLYGRLRNGGLMTARVTGAWINLDGRRGLVRTRCDPSQGGGGWASHVVVPPQSVLDLEADLDGLDLRADARPSLYMEFEQVGADTGLKGVTIVLFRQGASVADDWQWRVGAIRPALLP